MIAYMLQFAAVTAFIFIVAGGLVYASLNVFLIRPIKRITVAMEQFRERPEDPSTRVPLSGRRDEIGRAEAELSRMQDELRQALQSRARLAALGEAVAKINHDLRNILTSAQMAFERLQDSGDPRIAKALPRLERALNRAIKLAQDVLDYGKSEEPAPQPQPVALSAAAAVAGEDAGLGPEGAQGAQGVALQIELADGIEVAVDPDHLHRILVNLFRNAREAIEGRLDGERTGWVRLSAAAVDGLVRMRVADNGPGVPERAQERLFQPFVGSGRRGGTGLGLAIARDLARANGGELELVETGPDGAAFELTLPAA